MLLNVLACNRNAGKVLLQHLYHVSRLLPRRDDLVISPIQRELIMQAGIPQLAAWPLSGCDVNQEAFQQRLLDYSQPPGETKPLSYESLSLLKK